MLDCSASLNSCSFQRRNHRLLYSSGEAFFESTKWNNLKDYCEQKTFVTEKKSVQLSLVRDKPGQTSVNNFFKSLIYQISADYGREQSSLVTNLCKTLFEIRYFRFARLEKLSESAVMHETRVVGVALLQFLEDAYRHLMLVRFEMTLCVFSDLLFIFSE